jgi:ABC-type Mn2+/Zn2+ transport system ATPase subunit
MQTNDRNDDYSLVVAHLNQTVFTNGGKWLHPLFELGDFLEKNKYPLEELQLTDKIAGKAAAFLIVRLCISQVHIKLISEGALAVFKRFGRQVSYDILVPVIQCKTEQLISVDDEPEAVWQMLRRRAGRVSGVELQIADLHVEHGSNKILNGLDLVVKKGEHLIVKGPNGAGKTTLLKAILGLTPITKGSVSVNGFLVGSAQWEKQRSIIGYVNQKQVKSNFPVSAYEVAEIGLSARNFSRSEIRHRTEIAMRRTGCFHLSDRLYHTLSGGEQQRVSIARGMCQQAQLLLFDEPTSFLDASAKDDLKQVLIELWSNEAPTIVIVSHDEQWLQQFNWPVLELQNGKLCSNY